jgi:hypothetical protein
VEPIHELLAELCEAIASIRMAFGQSAFFEIAEMPLVMWARSHDAALYESL